MENLWYNKHRHNYAYSLSSSHKSKYNKKEMIYYDWYLRNKKYTNNILKHFLCQLDTT